MTSGVKQALPQFAMPKTGVEGKTQPGRKGGADFTEALGKLVEKAQAGNAKEARATAQDTDMRTGWPRFANRLDASEDGTSQQASPLDGHAISATLATKGDAADETDPEGKQDDPAPDARTPAQQAHLDRQLVIDARADKGREPERQAAPPVIPTDGDTAGHDEPAALATSLAPANRPAAAERSAPPARISASATPASSEPDQSTEETGPDEAVTAKDTSRSQSFVPMGRGQQAEPIRFEPVTRTTTDGAQQSSDKDKASAESLSGRDAAPAPRITIVSQQNIPAPTASTAVVLVETIAASDLLEPAVTKFSFDAIHASGSPASAQSLKIQLHPAELGMVTATLRFAGDQLSIELKVENQEAYRRLSSDSDIIVNSLRDLGYDIDRVTVIQPSAPAPGAKADASMSMTPSQGRSAEQFGQGANGENAGSGGRPSGEDRSARAGGQQGPTSPQRESAGGVYI